MSVLVRNLYKISVIPSTLSKLCSRMPLKPAITCHHGPTNTFFVSSPIGDMEIVSCPKGLHCVQQNENINDDNFCPNASVKVEVKSQLYPDNGYTYKPALLCVDWLKDYFKKNPQKMPPICPSIAKEGSFTALVWKTLPEKVGFGQTISYGGLAKLCGNEKASRAVGHAMSHNNIQLLMPCHRVIQSNGSLGNYHWGNRNTVKHWLLKYEGSMN